MSPLQGKVQHRKKQQLQEDAGQGGDKVSGGPYAEGIGPCGEEKRLGQPSCDAACQHGCGETDVKICRCFSRVDQLHQQTGDKAIEGQLHKHSVQDGACRGHAADHA